MDFQGKQRDMTVEEMNRERQASGWNPYWAEEEDVKTAEKEEAAQSFWSPLMWDDPVLEGQRQAERDLRQLQFMYPETAKTLLPDIEDACDRMEYEGSLMYDQYPDKSTVLRISDRIYERVKDLFPLQKEAERDEMLSMQYQEERKLTGNWVKDLIRVLLLNEMHHRRRRKKNLFK